MILWGAIISLFILNANGKDVSRRSLKGDFAVAKQFPYIAAIRSAEENLYICAATVINANHVLTPASCLQPRNSKLFYATDALAVYAYTLESRGTGGIQSKVSEIFTHPMYTRAESFNANDIAILELKTSLYWFWQAWTSNRVQPIKITNAQPSDMLTVISWGSVDPRISTTEQFLNYQTFIAIEANQRNGCIKNLEFVCAVPKDFEGGICYADAGGALVKTINKQDVLVGLVSNLYNERCDAGVATSFTRVENYADWIKGITGLNILY